MNYLARAVPESVRQLAQADQVPFFDTTTEDFPVAMLRGGRGLPAAGWEAVKTEYTDPYDRIPVGSMSGGTINMGDTKVDQRGKYNINADQVSGTAIGDGAQVHNYGTPKSED